MNYIASYRTLWYTNVPEVIRYEEVQRMWL